MRIFVKGWYPHICSGLRNPGIWCEAENVEGMFTVTDFKITVCSGTWNEGTNVTSEDLGMMEEKYLKRERAYNWERVLSYYIPVSCFHIIHSFISEPLKCCPTHFPTICSQWPGLICAQRPQGLWITASAGQNPKVSNRRNLFQNRPGPSLLLSTWPRLDSLLSDPAQGWFTPGYSPILLSHMYLWDTRSRAHTLSPSHPKVLVLNTQKKQVLVLGSALFWYIYFWYIVQCSFLKSNHWV